MSHPEHDQDPDAFQSPMIRHADIVTNGVRLHVVQAGPDKGPLVVLLHGFPEFWYAWRRQILHLARAGYRVWTPDQRGYNTSEKPWGLAAYSLDALADDVTGLIDAAGRQKAILVGHDWGGVVAWQVAARFPERVARLVILNAPHPAAYERQVRRDFAQALRSWYVLFFQLPWLPEAGARVANWRVATRALVRTSRPGTFPPEVLACYQTAWSQPGAYSSMLNWYRAARRHRRRLADTRNTDAAARIPMPTLVIWGAQDRFLGRELADASVRLCDNGRVAFLDKATHWVQHEESERVNQLLDGFLGAAETG